MKTKATSPAVQSVICKERPRCAEIAEGGISTSQDFVSFMSNIISDIIAERVRPQVANAAVNAGGKMLKVIEMEYKYGQAGKNGKRSLLLINGAK